MPSSAAFEPAVRSSDHSAGARQADGPWRGAQTSGSRAAGQPLRPSQAAPVPARTTGPTGSSSPAGGTARHRRQRLRPSGAPAGAALTLARPSAVPAKPVQDVLRGPGQQLAAPLKEEMEARLGADLSGARIHAGPAAQAAVAAVGARAWTSGSHLVIGDGGADKHTLAHELTHVIQQRQGPVTGTDHGNGLRVSDPADRYEKAAEANATRVMRAPLSQHRLAAAGISAPEPEDTSVPRAPAAATPVLQRAGEKKRKRGRSPGLERERTRESGPETEPVPEQEIPELAEQGIPELMGEEATGVTEQESPEHKEQAPQSMETAESVKPFETESSKREEEKEKERGTAAESAEEEPIPEAVLEEFQKIRQKRKALDKIKEVADSGKVSSARELVALWNQKANRYSKIDEEDLVEIMPPSPGAQAASPEVDLGKIWTPGLFGNGALNAADHFRRHGREVGYGNLEQYVNAALAVKQDADYGYGQLSHGGKTGYVKWKGTLGGVPSGWQGEIVIEGDRGQIASFYLLSRESAIRNSYKGVPEQLYVLANGKEPSQTEIREFIEQLRDQARRRPH
jgi:hypothetical protein